MYIRKYMHIYLNNDYSWNYLKPRTLLLKRGAQIPGVSIAWEIHSPGPDPDLLNSHMHFNKICRSFIFTWKFGKFCSRNNFSRNEPGDFNTSRNFLKNIMWSNCEQAGGPGGQGRGVGSDLRSCYRWEVGKGWAVDHSDFGHAEFFYLYKRNPLIK